jgi:hypothetical protein
VYTLETPSASVANVPFVNISPPEATTTSVPNENTPSFPIAKSGLFSVEKTENAYVVEAVDFTVNVVSVDVALIPVTTPSSRKLPVASDPSLRKRGRYPSLISVSFTRATVPQYVYPAPSVMRA